MNKRITEIQKMLDTDYSMNKSKKLMLKKELNHLKADINK